MIFGAFLAHQGGWDEAILVVLPLIVLAALLRIARRRALEEASRDDDPVTDAVASRRADPGIPPEQ